MSGTRVSEATTRSIWRFTRLAGLTLFGDRPPHAPSSSARRAGGRDATWLALRADRGRPLDRLIPCRPEAVTYVVQRAESMMGLFYLAGTLYGFIRGIRREDLADPGRAWPGLLLEHGWRCALGHGDQGGHGFGPARGRAASTTESSWPAVSGPAWHSSPRALTWASGRDLAPARLAGGGCRRSAAARPVWGSGVGAPAYWLTQFPAIAHYLRLAVWPHPLVFDYGTAWVSSDRAGRSWRAESSWSFSPWWDWRNRLGASGGGPPWVSWAFAFLPSSRRRA